MIERAAKEVKEKSGGRVEIQGFPGGQMGGSRDVVEAVASGALDMTTEGAALLGQFVPQLSIIEAPYIWRDAEHMARALKSPLLEELNKLMVERRGLRMIGVTYYGKRHLTTGSKAVRTVDDMKGFKLRVPEVDTFRAMAEAWGARATPLNFNELYLSLSQGAVDGQENPLPTIASGKLNEVQKYLVLTGHIITPRLVIVNERAWTALPEADRSIVRSAIEFGCRLAGQGDRGPGGLACRDLQEGRHAGHRAGPRKLPQAGARLGAGEVRGQVGQGLVGTHPGALSRVSPCLRSSGRSRISSARIAAVAILLGLLASVVLGVVFRAIGDPLIWSDELARYLMVWLALFGWIMASRRRSHIRITVVLDSLPAFVRRILEIAIQIAIAGFGVLLVKDGVILVDRNLDVESVSLPLPSAIIYVPIVLAGAVTVLQAVDQVVELFLRRRAPGSSTRREASPCDDADAADQRCLAPRHAHRRAAVCLDGARGVRVRVAQRPHHDDRAAEDRPVRQLLSDPRGAAVHPDGQHHELGRDHRSASSPSRRRSSAGCAAACAMPTSSPR